MYSFSEAQLPNFVSISCHSWFETLIKLHNKLCGIFTWFFTRIKIILLGFFRLIPFGFTQKKVDYFILISLVNALFQFSHHPMFEFHPNSTHILYSPYPHLTLTSLSPYHFFIPHLTLTSFLVWQSLHSFPHPHFSVT